jgi:tripartite-type tricarboxylate transporter receptor subunit TctC
MSKIRSILAAAALGFAAASPTQAADFPERPVRMVVPFAAGGSTDVVARIVAQEMSKTLGQQVVVENRAGAGGALGSEAVAKAQPDGYTILAATVSTHAINPSLYKQMSFDTVKDFAGVTHLVNVPNVLVASGKLPIRNIEELRAYIEANPGRVNYASPGNGSIGHLQSHWFARMIGAEMTHVPYRGAGPALQDVIAGAAQLMVDNVPTSLAHIRSGALHAIVVSGEKRIPQLPDTPSSPEIGLPDFIGYSWVALLAPQGTPQAAVDALDRAARAALANPEVRKRLEELSAEIVAAGPAATDKHIADEREKWAPIVRATGVTLD